MSRFRLLFTFLATFALAAALAACGGDDGGSDNANPQEVLDRTFSSSTEVIKSGDQRLSLQVESRGTKPSSFDLEIRGPFESATGGEPPKFDVELKIDSSGQGQLSDFDGGLITTGDAAYLRYQGDHYEAPPELLDRFESVTQAQGALQGQNESAQQLLDLLGIEDAKTLLTNIKSEGEAEVDGTSTNHVSGDLDVEKTLEAVKTALGGASALGALGGSGSSLPDVDQIEDLGNAIERAHFDVYSGTDDNILRRLTVDLALKPKSGSVDAIDLSFDYSVGKVNEPQAIEAPPNPKPVAQLLQQLGGGRGQLEGVGDLGLGSESSDAGGGGGGALGGGSGGGGPTTPALPGSTPDADAAQEYLNCVSDAQSAADLQACSDLAPAP